MRIAMIGSGYVGLVSGACFSEFGHIVSCVDNDPKKIESLKSGRMPIYEPGLEEVVADSVKAGRLSFTSDLSKPIVFNVREKWGDFYSGKRYETSGGITWRPNTHLLVDLSESYNKVRLPEGNFSTSLFAGRVNYNFSRKLLTSALVQLNSAARLSALNVRLRYIYRPNSDFFIIYNQTTGAGLERPSYSFQIKLTRDLTF